MQLVTGIRFSAMRGLFSVTGGEVDGNDRDGDDGGKHDTEHNENEPGSAICRLRCGLGNAHGIDKQVRDELNEFHTFSMWN